MLDDIDFIQAPGTTGMTAVSVTIDSDKLKANAGADISRDKQLQMNDLKFPRGTKMFFKSDSSLAYEKLGDSDFDWWVSLNSFTLEEVKKLTEAVSDEERENFLCVENNGKTTTVYVKKPDSEKPLYDEKSRLNRFGFRWTDQQVYDYYKTIMDFKI